MSDAIKAILHSIQSDMKQVDVISQNVANAQTPGFRAAKTTGVSFEQALNSGSEKLIQQTMNPTSGTVKVTGNPLHATVQGEGFFVVARSQANLKLSKNLQLSVNSDNELQTQSGINLGIYIDGDLGGAIEITQDGKVKQGNQEIGEVEVVSIKDYSKVLNASGSIFEIKEDYVQETDVKVLHGALELSNVDSSQEIIKLMMLSKHVESNQRSLLTLDQMLDSGINEIGKR
ncbi:flagellar basal body rod C-terminal domain-containing protein [Pleionea sediminis]|uniref:flagellar basal body rod C-terminal domain-containing protein n=1 Tax=Pleionea sediminis TaxID=2569479 RepID=UPI0011848980|nr:flagellar basal body rod C-terminal domain-containing protein [Pleionea sediminis]